MKKLFSLLSIFAIMLSCSSDETSTPALIVKYTITLSAGEGGTVSTTGGEYESGQTVSVTATPQVEYVFTSWSDGNTNATRTITVSSNSTLTANFEKKKYLLTVNIEGEGGTVSTTGGEYEAGQTVSVTATPLPGYIFKSWSDGDTNSTRTIVVSSETTIIALFEMKWYADEVYSTILTEGEDQDVYKSYLKAFIADAKRHNVDLSHVDVERSLFELVDADVVAARASCDPFKASIIWNKEAWLNRYPLNKTEEPYRIYIFWHEFGHDLLGLDHLCRSGHIMTGRHTECRGDGNEGDEINLYGLKYNTDEDIRDFRRAVDDMFGMVDQIYLGCRTSLTTKAIDSNLIID